MRVFTSMASLRRLLLRKKRCIVFLAFSILVVYSISLMYDFDDMEGIKSTQEAPVVKKIEPKYNVLEPPANQVQHDIVKGTPHAPVNPIQNEEDAKPIAESKKTSHEEFNIQELPKQEKNPEPINDHILQPAKNETKELEVAQNKTLKHLAVLGGDNNSEKSLPKIVWVKKMWNLTVSFEDIGNIMKDTSFLNKLKPLNLSGPMLTSTRNRTANFSYSMPFKKGYCDCWEHYCYCCAQLLNPQLHLNVKTCSNFTFISKSHNFDLTFYMDNTTVYKGIVSADAPPLLCLGSIPSVADICVHFSNLTYRVDRLAMHKSQVLGCTDFSLNIYNKTISVFPVDCFQIPGDPNHHPKKENLIIPNFVP